MDTQEKKIGKYDKGQIVLYKGDVCKYGFFVKKGCLKSYVIDKSGKEHILQFAPENWFVSDIESLLTGKPSKTFIEAVEETEVELFPKSYLDKKYLMTKEELLLQNQKLIRNILMTNRRLASILSATGEERYLDFLNTYPSLAQRLPLKLIASYIGITPEYLSDIRKKLAKK